MDCPYKLKDQLQYTICHVKYDFECQIFHISLQKNMDNMNLLEW